MARRSAYELYVVKWDDLEPLIRKWEDEWNSRHRNIKNKWSEVEVKHITGREHLAQAAGVSIGRIDMIMARNPKKRPIHIQMSLADDLLNCIGKGYLLSDGTIEPIPNPAISPERWAERMRKRGCYD